jgi:hypothetical protein
MKVTMMLCDFAEASGGKLYIVGGGWSIKGHDTPMGLALKIEVPWSEANRKHSLKLNLRTNDGQPVLLDTPMGPQALELDAGFEVGRPPGLREGTPLDYPLAINMGPLPLPPDTRMEWRLTINEKSEPDWYVSFVTAPGPAT